MGESTETFNYTVVNDREKRLACLKKKMSFELLMIFCIDKRNLDAKKNYGCPSGQKN